MKSWLIFFNVTLITLLSIASTSSVIVATPTIIGALAIPSAYSNWLSTCYLMTLGSCIPVVPWIAEKYGSRIIFFLGVLIYMVGSGLAGLAYDFYSLIFFRIMEGLGAGIIFPLALVILARAFPKEKLGLVVSLYTGLSFGVGAGLGFVAGGYLSEYVNWQSVFWLNLVFCIPSAFITWFVHAGTEKKQMPPFDKWGYFFFCSFIVNLLVVVNVVKQPWNTDSWTSTLVLTCLTVSVLSFITMILIERVHPYPIIPLKLFSNASYSISCLAIALIGVILFGVIGIYPIYFFEYLRYDNFKSGLYVAPLGLVLGVFGIISGILVRKINIKILVLMGLLFIVTACFLNHSITLYSDHFQIGTVLVFYAMGVALSLSSITALGLSVLSKDLAGPGAGMLTFFRQMGAAFGSSIISIIIVVRTEFHNTIFGPSINPYQPAYKDTLRRLSYHIVGNGGKTPEEALDYANRAIVQTAVTQSKIAGMVDSFFVFGCIISFFCLYFAISIGLDLYKARKKNGSPAGAGP